MWELFGEHTGNDTQGGGGFSTNRIKINGRFNVSSLEA